MLTITLLHLLACGRESALEDTTAPPEPTGDTAEPTPVLGDGWYSVEGSFDIVDGTVLQGTVELKLWQKDERGAPEPICSEQLQLVEPALVTGPRDDVQLYGLWVVPLAVETCTGGPSQMTLGIGPLPRELWPAAEAQGASSRHARGLYTIARRELLVFGIAGTAAQLDGRGAPTSLDPLPDGTYELHTAFLLDL